MADVTIRRGDAHDLDLLEPLWVAVHHQHRARMPHLGPYVDDEVTWRHRRDLYTSLFERYDPCLQLAMDGGRPIGYGLAYVMPAHDTWLADTWTTGTVIGEVESLSVLPEHRGRGVGTRLLTELHHHLRDAGVRDVIIGVLPGNTDAQRLYTRHDHTPTWPTARRDVGGLDHSACRLWRHRGGWARGERDAPVVGSLEEEQGINNALASVGDGWPTGGKPGSDDAKPRVLRPVPAA